MKVQLTKEEIADRGQQLAGLIDSLYAERGKKRDDNSEHNKLIKDIEKQIADLTLVVRTGIEFQDDDLLPFASKAAS